MLMLMPAMLIRVLAMMAEKMAITRVATTRHLLPLRAPPMASPPVVMKNTAAKMPEALFKPAQKSARKITKKPLFRVFHLMSK